MSDSELLKIGLPPIVIHERLTAQEVGEQIPWNLADLQIPEAWKKTRGAGVNVGICDTGIDHSHEDMDGKVLNHRDFSGSPSGSADTHGHGTHVAGTVTANEGNRLGVAGVAPDARLIIAKGLGDNGGGSDYGIAQAILWLIAEGADIINLSLGSSQQSRRITDAVERAIDAGIPVVCASGNAGLRSVSWPAQHPDTISVGATDRQQRPAQFTSPSSVNIAAPGVEILSCYRANSYAVLSGTSMAAPFVSGVIALIFAAESKAGRKLPTPSEVTKILEAQAIDIAQPGRDPQTGAGLVSVRRIINEPAPGPDDPGGPVEPPGEKTRITIEQGDKRVVLVAGELAIQ